MDIFKTAVITGGAQGIGKAVCSYFLNKGVRVIVADIDGEAGKEFLEQENNDDLHFCQADISRENDVKKLVDETLKFTDRVDFLVNNAGISKFFPISDITLDDWNSIIGTNLTGAFLCAKHFLKHLKETRGRIVQIASTRAIQSESGNEAYSASKGGIIALTHALANSLGPEILVNCISPGWIEVGNWKKREMCTEPDLSEKDHRQHPSGRVGTPIDIAELTYFLCVEQSGFITGQNFIVDGGMTRKMIYQD